MRMDEDAVMDIRNGIDDLDGLSKRCSVKKPKPLVSKYVTHSKNRLHFLELLINEFGNKQLVFFSNIGSIGKQLVLKRIPVVHERFCRL